ncbi:DUF305 domain-containing protein [Pseudaminobacter arsenicus]|uniref:DUF305 domain-containing protein n=1 Tax=Borborobacter arsenicus TaxID=1851146 RepID=A0A432V5E9_9HYPH|nr:DUF305 domain-containing protein [Pseudaminobacter arsenicus]RUM97384.1 DUF305 domain-containing protein [Pseudaminobacter arsenicus]
MTLTRRLVTLSAVVMLGASAAGLALAQSDHSGHDMGSMSTSDGASSPAAKGYIEAMDKMHEAMGKMDYSGDPDIDFARGMIPHHQAAIDMAKVQLEHGKDPEIRKLSEAAQEREIKQLEDWLAAHPAK